MKAAHTPPKNSVAEQSKFNRMKSKPQLKGTANVVVESGEPHLTDVSAEPSKMQEDLPVDDNEQDVHSKEDDDEPVTRVNKKRNQSCFFNRSSPMKLVRVCKGMNPSQRGLISKHFVGIVGMKCSRLNPELCRFLMSCYDPVKSILDFGDRGKIPVSAQSVVEVLGIPMGSLPVPYNSNPDATRLVLDMFGIHDGVHPLVTTVETQLGPNFPADDAYLSKFVIYMISSVFAPTTAVKVSPKCYPSVANTNDISSLNWAQFIVDILCQTASAKDKKNWFKACMPYLMIRYVDSLETDALDVPQDGTRCLFWTNKMINTIAALDTHADGSFGALPLKACFRMKLSLFTSEPSQVDVFVKQYLPSNHTDQDLETCRAAVINMYTLFEDGLGTFIRSLLKGKSTSAMPVKQGADCVKKPRRKRSNRAASDVEQKEEYIQTMAEETGDAGAGPSDAPLHDAMGGRLASAGLEEAAPCGDIQTMDVDPVAPEIGDAGAVQSDAHIHDAMGGTLSSAGLEEADPCGDIQAMDVDPVAPETGDDPLHDAPLHDSMGGTLASAVLEEEALHDVTPKPLGDNHMETRSVGKGTVGTSVHENTSTNVSGLLHGSPNALSKLQQLYGSGSQLSTPLTEDRLLHPPSIQHDNESFIKSDVIATATTRKKKSVSFVVHGQEQCQKTATSPQQVASNAHASANKNTSSPRRPVTRSMSPMKIASTADQIPQRSNLSKVSATKQNASSPRRSTRFALSEAARVADTKANVTCYENVHTSMNRNLENEFSNSKALVETESQRKHREFIEYCPAPSFDLGFESQASDQPIATISGSNAQQEEVVIISSNESGDSLDKIYSTIEIPVRTPGIEKNETEPSLVTSVGQSSCTPIPEAHKKRILKPTMMQKSPFVVPDKKQVASTYAEDVYRRVCSYAGKKKDGEHGEKIIDYGDFYVYLWDLANSVMPGEWISNSTCQIALHVLSAEVAEQKKYVMPIVMADKLRNPNCIHDRFVKNTFKITPECRLDHKEHICFPVVQDLTPDIKDFNGHYYVIVLNLKAERFEVMDSLRSKGDRVLLKDARNIIGSIKGLWSSHYSQSKINIERWPTEYIDTPKQKTSFDCGYFMLNFIELWNGRKFISPINPESMPTIRKQLTLKWLQWVENTVEWQELLF